MLVFYLLTSLAVISLVLSDVITLSHPAILFFGFELIV